MSEYVITKLEPCEHCIDGKLGVGQRDPATHEWKNTVELDCPHCDGHNNVYTEVGFAEFAQSPEFEAAISEVLAKFSRQFHDGEGH